MATAVPVRGWVVADDPEVGVVDQGRRPERRAGLLLRQATGRQPGQVDVGQRQVG